MPTRGGYTKAAVGFGLAEGANQIANALYGVLGAQQARADQAANAADRERHWQLEESKLDQARDLAEVQIALQKAQLSATERERARDWSSKGYSLRQNPGADIDLAIPAGSGFRQDERRTVTTGPEQLVDMASYSPEQDRAHVSGTALARERHELALALEAARGQRALTEMYQREGLGRGREQWRMDQGFTPVGTSMRAPEPAGRLGGMPFDPSDPESMRAALDFFTEQQRIRSDYGPTSALELILGGGQRLQGGGGGGVTPPLAAPAPEPDGEMATLDEWEALLEMGYTEDDLRAQGILPPNGG